MTFSQGEEKMTSIWGIKGSLGRSWPFFNRKKQFNKQASQQKDFQGNPFCMEKKHQVQTAVITLVFQANTS